MSRWSRIAAGVVGVALASGCVRAATKVTEMPRVDLNLQEGNRGYLVGVPPDAPSQKTTRQMIGTDVEIPSFYKPTRTGTASTLDAMAPPETELDEPGAPSGAPSHYDTYVVQKGDSLWSIAANPEIYGKASKWRRIFDANRDLLKSPDRVRAGMTLKIPRGESEDGGSTTYDDDGGITYKK